MNATGLSHPRWAWLLNRSDTWNRCLRTDEDTTLKWAEGLQEMVNRSDPEYLEFARTVAWELTLKIACCWWYDKLEQWGGLLFLLAKATQHLQ